MTLRMTAALFAGTRTREPWLVAGGLVEHLWGRLMTQSQLHWLPVLVTGAHTANIMVTFFYKWSRNYVGFF